MMELPMKNLKRRSHYGNYQIWPRKDFCLSTTDRIKYKIIEDGDRIYHPETLKLLTKHNWNLYRASHLWKLEYSTVKLKQYAAYIKQELVQNISNITSNVYFNVNVRALPEPEELDGNSKSLEIEVFYRKDENNPALKYRSILLSWENKHNCNNLTHLPFLLCVGTPNVIKIVHQALSHLFDTLLHHLHIPEEDLLWLSAILRKSENDLENVTYDFSIIGSSMKNTITIILPSTIIENLWKFVHPPQSDEIHYYEIQKFYEHLQNQLEVNYGINFKFFKLNRITMNDATITREGKIKFHSTDATEKVLSFITDISIILDNSCHEISDESSNVQ